jgi:hypothetical protein
MRYRHPLTELNICLPGPLVSLRDVFPVLDTIRDLRLPTVTLRVDPSGDSRFIVCAPHVYDMFGVLLHPSVVRPFVVRVETRSLRFKAGTMVVNQLDFPAPPTNTTTLTRYGERDTVAKVRVDEYDVRALLGQHRGHDQAILPPITLLRVEFREDDLSSERLLAIELEIGVGPAH